MSRLIRTSLVPPATMQVTGAHFRLNQPEYTGTDAKSHTRRTFYARFSPVAKMLNSNVDTMTPLKRNFRRSVKLDKNGAWRHPELMSQLSSWVYKVIG